MSTVANEDQLDSSAISNQTELAVNLNDHERQLSTLAGGALLGMGLGRGNVFGGLLLAGMGAALIHRGLTGHCYLYEALGRDTSELGIGDEQFTELENLDAENTPVTATSGQTGSSEASNWDSPKTVDG